MPQWLSDYTQALIARANMVAAEPYQAYQGPRVAGFTDDQTNAFDVIRNNIGNWNDEFDASKSATSGALSQSMPYFEQAAESTPENIQQYMDPYVGSVIDRAKLEANRQWDEKIMPGIENRFITSGQSGSSGHRIGLERAGRDVAEGINSQSLAALSDAYKTAGSQFGADASRQAGIGTNIGALGLQTGQQMSGLAQMQQQLSGRDASSLSLSGEAQQQQTQRNLDTAYGDFQSQRDYPKEQTDWMSSIIRGLPHDTTTSTSSTGPANVYQPSPLSQLISLYGLYKDVTDKAEGGVVRRKPDVSRLLALIKDRNAVEEQARGIALPGDNEFEEFAEGGAVHHTPGPGMGVIYGRYAEGGKVGTARRLLKWIASTDPEYDVPDTDEAALKVIEGIAGRRKAADWVRQHEKDFPMPSAKKMQATVKRAMGGLACLEY
jgi:hypothetical protein